jgi:hypothetical protein
MPSADERTCPDCAETIKTAAKVCKHCGLRFPAKTAATASPKPVKRIDPAPLYRCPHCSKPTSKAIGYCIHCDHSFRKSAGPTNGEGDSSGEARRGPKSNGGSGSSATRLVMGVTLCGALIWGVNSCSSSRAESERQDRIEALQRDIAETRARIPDLQTQCKYGPKEDADDARDRYLAEWDSAVGDNLANIAPDQEWAIRAALGREMGLPPSQVNGWKQIYESRAQAAKATLARIESEKKQKAAERDKEQQEICDRLELNRSSLKEDQAELRRLQKQ